MPNHAGNKERGLLRPRKGRPMCLPSAGRTRRSAPTGILAFVATIALLIAAAACGNIRTGEVEVYGVARFKMPAVTQTGANKIQTFTEMHYSPSYRSQEGPRLLPPPDSVPITGRELRYASLEEYSKVGVPPDIVESYDSAAAQHLYTINCQVCHGPTLKGEKEESPALRATILPLMPRGPFPADLTGLSARPASSTDGALFAFITEGGRQGYALKQSGRESASPMPEFRRLLTEAERWWLVMYIRAVQAQP